MGSSSYQKVGFWFTSSPCLHVEVSLGKILNPRLSQWLFYRSVGLSVFDEQLALCMNALAFSV